jgi:hypothetical protein
MGTHRKILGIWHVVMGFITLTPILIVGLVFGGISSIVAMNADSQQTAVVGVSLAVILGIVAVVLGFAGALGIIAGLGVLKGYRWGDVLATVLAVLQLFNVPFGTALAIYTVWALWIREPAPLQAFPKPDL